MTQKTERAIVCDECNTNTGPLTGSFVRIEVMLLRAGWLVGFYEGCPVHLCPDCLDKGKPGWWNDHVREHRLPKEENDDDDDYDD